MSEYYFGLDFGTSNSVISAYNKKDNSFKNILEPSLLFFPNHEHDVTYHIGSEARDEYIKTNMNGRFIKSVKSILHRSSFTYTTINYKDFYPEDLISLILKNLKNKLEKQLEFDIKKVTIGRPVFFSNKEGADQLSEERLTAACNIAGFEEVLFQYEPIAAAFEYVYQNNSQKKILIGDIGGGTSDFSILSVPHNADINENPQKYVVANSGVYVGGDALNVSIMWKKLIKYFGYDSVYDSFGKELQFPAYILKDLCSWEKVPFLNNVKTLEDLTFIRNNSNRPLYIENTINLIKNNLVFALFQSIIEAKHNLSTEDEAMVFFNNSDILLAEKIDFHEFNEMIRDNVDKIDKGLDQCLKSAGLKPADIDLVLLTGGTTYVKGVYKIFEDKFPGVEIIKRDVFESVSRGLALSSFFNRHN